MREKLRFIKPFAIAASFLVAGALTGVVVPAQPLQADDEWCFNDHYCQGGSEGTCEPDLARDRWCEYSASGEVCTNWSTGECPPN